MNIEKELNNLNRILADQEFKSSLRERVLNQYALIIGQNSDSNTESSGLRNIHTKIYDFFYRIVKFNSALSLSLVILLFISFGSYASFTILPENIKTTVTESFKSINKPKVDFEVVANIEGASVFVDDKYVGMTPLDLNIREGSYDIRVEKDGYIAYKAEVVLDPLKDSNKLSIELPKVIKADNWIKYKNENNDLSFFYPDTWNLIEKKIDTASKVSQIIVENGNTSLGISLDSPDEEIMLNVKKEKIYIGEMSVNEKLYKRYLVFNQFGEYTLGGVWIDDEKLGRVNIAYNFNDIHKDQLLGSQQLNILDQITKSFLSSQSDEYIYNPQNFEAVSNIEYIPENIAEDPTFNPDSGETEEVEYLDISDNAVNSNEDLEYVNKVYGYKLNLPSEWFVSSSRAEYPLHDRGHLIERDGTSYKVARLKIYSNLEGIVYVFMTNNPDYDINDGGNLCNEDPALKKTIEIDDKLELVSISDPTKYNYQLCQKAGSVSEAEFTYESSKNGLIRYVIYWDASGSEIVEGMDLFRSLISSIEFNDKYVEMPIEKVEYTYKENGIQFNYKYSWRIEKSEQECAIKPSIQQEPTSSPGGTDSIVEKPVISVSPIDQVSQKCRTIGFFDNERLMLELIFGGNNELKTLEADQVRKERLVKGITVNDIYNLKKECEVLTGTEDSCQTTEDFNYGYGFIEGKDGRYIEFRYYNEPEAFNSLFRSIKLID